MKSEEVKKGNKNLWHIQNMDLGDNESAFDVFIWCDHEPNEKDLLKAFEDEFNGCAGVEEYKETFLSTSQIYKVWGVEV